MSMLSHLRDLENEEDLINYVLAVEQESREQNQQMSENASNVQWQATTTSQTNPFDAAFGQVQMQSLGDDEGIHLDTREHKGSCDIQVMNSITSNVFDQSLEPFALDSQFFNHVFGSQTETCCVNLNFEAAFQEFKSLDEQNHDYSSFRNSDTEHEVSPSLVELQRSNSAIQPQYSHNQVLELNQDQHNVSQQQFDAVVCHQQPQFQQNCQLLIPLNVCNKTLNFQQVTASVDPSCQFISHVITSEQIVLGSVRTSVLPTGNIAPIARFFPDVNKSHRAKCAAEIQRRKKPVKVKNKPSRTSKRSNKLQLRQYSKTTDSMETSAIIFSQSQPSSSKIPLSTAENTIAFPEVGNSPRVRKKIKAKIAKLDSKEKPKYIDHSNICLESLLVSSGEPKEHVRITIFNGEITPSCSL